MGRRLLLLAALCLIAVPASAGEPAPAPAIGRPSCADLFPFGIRGPRGGATTAPTRQAIRAGLTWLAAHQAPDGSWRPADFRRWCDGEEVLDADEQPKGRGKSAHVIGVTALAVLAFQGAGYTHTTPGHFGYAVHAGLAWLRKQQDKDGCIGKRRRQDYIYGHGFAALALVEAFGMTGDPNLRGPAQRALDFVALARNPYFAWRYGVKPGDNDTSITSCMLAPLYAARRINHIAMLGDTPEPLTSDLDAFDGARAWLDKVTDPDDGRVGYQRRGVGPTRISDLADRFPGEKSEAMTAAAIVMRSYMGEDPRKSKLIQRGADLCAKLPPTWNETDGSIDMIYWYYGSLAMYQVGGKHWQTWQGAVDQAIVGSQRADTTFCQYRGSWDPVGAWGTEGGRVFSTALMVLALETPWRYPRVHGRDDAPTRIAAAGDTSLAPAVRARIVRGLAHRPPRGADEALARAVNADSIAVRRAAARAILELPAEAAARKALAARMADTDLLVRVLALAVGGGDAAKVIGMALKDGTSEVVLAALDEITRRGVSMRAHAETVVVPPAAKDRTTRSRRVAATLARLRGGVAGSPATDAEIAREGLVASDWATRARAASLAGMLLKTEPTLVTALADVLMLDDEPLVAAAAARALGSASRDDPAVQAVLHIGAVRITPAAAEVLQRLGADERIALKGLVTLLQDKRRRVRDLATRTIPELGPGTTDDLIALLAGGMPASGPAITALAHQGTKAVPRLLAAIGHETPSVRHGVVEALGRMKPADPRAIPALVARAGDADVRVRAAAARAIERLGWQNLPEDGLPPEAELLAALRHSEVARRMHAVVALPVGGVRVEGAYDGLAALLGDPDEKVAARAGAALSALGAKSTPAVIRVLEDGSHAMRLRAVAVVKSLGPKAHGAAKPLAALLDDLTLLEPALAALQAIGKPAVKPLVAVLRKGRDVVKVEVIKTLARLGGDAAPATGVLVDYVRKQGVGDVLRRNRTWAALKALGRIGERAVSRLRPLLKHDSPVMRGMVAETLGDIGSTMAFAALRKALKEESDSKAKSAMQRAIRRLGRNKR